MIAPANVGVSGASSEKPYFLAMNDTCARR